MLAKVGVNTFQKSFDRRRRNMLFILRQGSVIKYLVNRCKWHLYPKMNRVSGFPLHVDIETTAKCNLSCPMCPSRHVSKVRYKEYGHMDMGLFKRIVDECVRNKVYSIRLSWRGEVLVNPRLSECVYYAKVVKRIPSVSFLTNGSLLRGEIAEKLIDYGLDYISVSIDGMDDMYNKIRNPLKFNDIYVNLENFRKLKKDKGARKPLVRVTTLWPAIASDPTGFYDRIKDVCDKVVYNPLKDYSIIEPQRDDFICQFPWERLFIAFNGDVQPCSNTKEGFVIGSVLRNNIKEIWHGEKMSQIRRLHVSGRRMEIFPCNRCSYGIDYVKVWQGRDWKNWEPKEMLVEASKEKAVVK